MYRGLYGFIGSLLCFIWMAPLDLQAEPLKEIDAPQYRDPPEHSWKDYFTSHGIILETVNTLDVLTPAIGGLRQTTATAGNLDLLLTIDADHFLGGKGSTFFVYGLGIYGENPSLNVGDVQGVSSIAGPNTWKLFEVWYQKNFFHNRGSLLLGLYDVTSEFDVIRSASELFFNGSFGTGAEFAASAGNGPSTFPATALAIRGQAILTESMAIRGVLSDGVPGDPGNPNGTQVSLSNEDGIFWGAEFAYYTFPHGRHEGDRQELLSQRRFRLSFSRVGRAALMEYQGKYAIGIWGYTTELPDLSEVNGSGQAIRGDGNSGLYVLAEQMVFQEDADDTQGLTVSARIGMADPRVNRFSQYYGGSVVYRGLVPGRPTDEFGLGMAAALNSSHYERGQQQAGQQVDDAEITLELTYSINLSPQVLLQPDLQYVINPGTNPTIKNAFILGIRVGLNFNWFDPAEGS